MTIGTAVCLYCYQCQEYDYRYCGMPFTTATGARNMTIGTAICFYCYQCQEYDYWYCGMHFTTATGARNMTIGTAVRLSPRTESLLEMSVSISRSRVPVTKLKANSLNPSVEFARLNRLLLTIVVNTCVHSGPE